MNKKNLVFAMIFLGVFLMVLSTVSAGFFDFITGDSVASDNPQVADTDYSKSNDWSKWFDIDGPSGDGDFESLKNFDVCGGKNPIDIECQTVDGEDYTETGQDVVCDVNKGFSCRNENQNFKLFRANCLDYKVRFYCGINPEDYTCTDSDGGKDYYVKGSTKLEPEANVESDAGTDYCAIPHYEKLERIDENGSQDWYQIDSCDNPVEQNNAQIGDCAVAGYKTKDSCSGEDCVVVEHYCANDDLKYGIFKDEHYFCPNGCQDGACIEESSNKTSTSDEVTYQGVLNMLGNVKAVPVHAGTPHWNFSDSSCNYVCENTVASDYKKCVMGGIMTWNLNEEGYGDVSLIGCNDAWSGYTESSDSMRYCFCA